MKNGLESHLQIKLATFINVDIELAKYLGPKTIIRKELNNQIKRAQNELSRLNSQKN